jgi:hypothetical protein
MATGFDVTAIAGYIDQESFGLISKSILETNLASFMNVRVGLQGNSVDIPLLDTDFDVQNGADCGWNASGDTTISVVPMTLKNNKVNVVQCVQTLRDTFFSQQLAAGAYNGGTSIPFEESLAEHFVGKLHNYNENFIINGDGAYSGLTDILTVANGVVSGATASQWTASNAVANAQALYAALPDKSYTMDDLVLIMSPQNYRALVLGITQGNYFHIEPGATNVFVPGTQVRAVASSGLVGSNVKFMGPTSALFMGTDLTSDFEQFRLWYSQDNDEMRGLMRWRLGVAVSEPSLFVAEL